ncbi:hypothetical protein JKP88DRAFT_165653 [Tribonema minus]|uniref:Uncharacterized protein n=1 Tax=Tribonema minus TaxID=303371 RepID=A0A835YWP5_9STRA|nr:hypothetical protein JKP88DRAFT_165653 [Tribonema minus]
MENGDIDILERENEASPPLAPLRQQPNAFGLKHTCNRMCLHGRKRYYCKECGGASICAHMRRRTTCQECKRSRGGAGTYEHGHRRRHCEECRGRIPCKHGRRRYRCTQCNGASICDHGRRRARCKECGGPDICAHGRQRSICWECKPALATKCEHGNKLKCQRCGGKPIKGAATGGAEAQDNILSAGAEVPGEDAAAAAGDAVAMRADAASHQERTAAV